MALQRLDAAATVVAEAVRVFANEEKARACLARANRGLEGKRPIDVLESLDGARAVADLLGQIDHGIFA